MDFGKEAANLSVEGSLGCRHDDQGVPLLSTSRASALKLALCLSVNPTPSSQAWRHGHRGPRGGGKMGWRCGSVVVLT